MSVHILVMDGNWHWQPRLRDISPGAGTAVLCRASDLKWADELRGVTAVVGLADDLPVEHWVAAAQHLHQEWRIDVIASLNDRTQDRTAAVAQALGLPFHHPDTVAWVHDKHRMRARLASAGVERVKCAQPTTLEELEDFFTEVAGPVVVKPTGGHASRGVTVVRTREELPAAWQHAWGEATSWTGDYPPLVEEYVPGPEYSVETLTHRGVHHVLAVTEKTSDPVTRVETGHVIPARLDGRRESALIAHTRSVLSALNIRFGLTHTEVIDSPNGPVTVETHLRKGGDQIEDLVREAAGVDMADLYLRQLTGQDIGELEVLRERRSHPVYRAAAAIRYLAPDRHGVLAGIDGWQEADADPGVMRSGQLVPDGTRLAGLKNSDFRLGFVRVCAPDAEGAVSRADHALGKLSVRWAE
ncbi:ATP-grasp domain-containing protein [Streptomyces sp. NPDC001966]